MANKLYRATKYMKAKDTMMARGGRLKKREKHNDPHPDRGRKSTRTSDKKDDRRSRPLLDRIANFTPVNAPLDQILMQIRDDRTKGQGTSIVVSIRTMDTTPLSATT